MPFFTLKAHSRDASVPFSLGHIARYAPSPEGNICAPIMHFQCKNNFEHLLKFSLKKDYEYPK